VKEVNMSNEPMGDDGEDEPDEAETEE